MAVKVYSTPSCPWCVMAKNFLKKHNIVFIDANVQEDREAAEEMIEKSGQMGVPVLDVNGEIIIGFNEKRLKEILKIR
jgi:glutaredoxin 3